MAYVLIFLLSEESMISIIPLFKLFFFFFVTFVINSTFFILVYFRIFFFFKWNLSSRGATVNSMYFLYSK